MELRVLEAGQAAGTLHGLTFFSNGDLPDPSRFLVYDFLVWHDAAYNILVKEADATLDPRLRMKKFAQCESRLLEVMPAIPVTFGRNLYLAKPYMRAFITVAGNMTFRYAWIDQGWKP